MRKIVIAALLTIAPCAPAFAEQATTVNAPAADIVVKGEQYEKKIVCRYQQNTGTRFSTRVCYTNKVWDEMREQNLRDAKQMLNQPTIDISRDGG